MMEDKDVAGIRISPANVAFYDTTPDSIEQLNVTVYNISKSSKSIRYYAPKTKKFKLKVKNPDKPVAPGLSVPAIIEYRSTEEGEFKDRIVVTVDGEVVEIPIVAHPTKPILEIDQTIDFGHVVANSKTIAREISLINHGSKSGEFKIKYAGDQPIAIMPTSGSVPPKSVQLIKIELVTKHAGKIEELVKVKLEGEGTKALTIRANCVQQALQVLSLETEEPINCIQFGNAYYGSDKTECAVLCNNGPEPVNFVAILDEDAIAQEMGIDLTKNTLAALADHGDSSQVQGETNELTSLVTAIPNQGILQPYERIPVFFRFSPRWNASKAGFKNKVGPPPRKDFALFLKLQIIGSSEAAGQADDKCIEVAMTGTALPVLLDISPATKYDFGEVPVGEHADILCTLKNSSDVLPTTFQFRRIAHFIAHPPNGKIQPLGTQDVIFSFAPNQAGFFKPQQMIDVIGHVADNRNPTLAHLQVIHTIPIHFLGRSDPITKHRNSKFNPGITPYISNEVGMFVDTTFASLNDKPRNAVAGGKSAKLHRLTTSNTEDDLKSKVAFPNDRAHSIRPSDRNESYKTIFTRTKRHTYIDPDYAHIDDDNVKQWKHRDSYVQLIREMKDRRLNKKKAREFNATNTSTDIGIKPAKGIRPKKLLLDEIKPDPRPPTPPNADFKLLSSKSLSATMSKVTGKPIRDGLNAVPTTSQEKVDCARFLTPQEQHQVVIGPALLDFGQVCLRSITTKNLEIVNNLDQNVLVVAEIDCRELRQSSPLSQVVPAKSKASIPIVFESNQKQKFQRSVTYTVNNYHKHHVTVLAEVVPVALQLSTEELLLKPSFGLPADAGFRGIITLTNKLNYPAEFTWAPNLGEKGTAFSIRPATGVVDPFKELDCEVVWHPSYLAPEDGSFSLMIHSGNTLQLRCKAELGPTNVQFVERRIIFGQVPVNLCTTRKILLANTGINHAYFQVNDPNPFPGLQVSPLHGVVPVGGNAELQVKLSPDAILKFDTRVQVAIKGGRNIELRMGGTVEPPTVDIDLPAFNFGGVFCGSGSTMPFKLINRMMSKAKLEFDLSRFKDFTLNFPGFQTQDDYTFQVLNPGMFSVTLNSEETVEGELIFMPTEVAAYDFTLPVMINHTGAPSPAPTPFPPTPAPSNKNALQHIINPKPQPFTVDTPRKHVIATALRQPLQLSTNKIELFAPASFHDVSIQSGQMQSKGTILVNNSDNELTWAIDLRVNSKAIEEGVFKFIHPSGAPFTDPGGEDKGYIEGSLKPGETQQVAVMFCPKTPGKYEGLFKVILNEQFDKPYQYLQVAAEYKAPRLWFDPLAIVLTPVPLLTEVSAEFTLFAAQFTEQTKIEVETPEVECEDGSKLSPLKVSFPEGQVVKPCCGDEGQVEPFSLPCKVTFASPRPVSFAKNVSFTFNGCGLAFTLLVTATADNCLMTCYPFLALHRTDHQIVCEQGGSPKGHKMVSKESLNNLGEAVFIPCQTPNMNSRPSTSATSSNFQVSSSSYESSDSVTDSSDGSTPVNRDGAKNKPPSGSDHQMFSRQNDLASRSLGSAMFPDEDSEEGIFHMEVLLAVQRWFSSQGWPGGPFPIAIPNSLRTLLCGTIEKSGISRKPVDEEKSPKSGSWDTNNLKKEIKTIYDMISHLAGRPVPGIPLNGHLPADPIERVKQVYWQHSTLLTFLRCQGACVASVKPEYLMDSRDYHLWKQMQTEIRMNPALAETALSSAEEELDDDVFEAVSKRAWTDILLQILKTLVLVKVTPRSLKNTASPDQNVSMPDVNPDPLSSNIYSCAERIILTWVNHHYEHYRKIVWQNCTKGGVPPARWIVNYDFDLLDGLVLGAVIGAHMPFLIKTHLQDMYTHPATAEQCLHNALKVVNAMRYAGIDYDIQAIDITDPNPIALLLLCSHLYQRLPQYLPKASVEFSAPLHATVSRQVKLRNPSGKPLVYQVLVAGHDARDFRVPKGEFVTIPPKSSLPLGVEFTSRFLRPAEAVLVLIGRRQGSAVGSTLTFSLRTQVENIAPKKVLQCESPCYELEKINIEVTNPFSESGEFRIVLVEASGALLDPGRQAAMLKRKEKKKRRIKSKIDSGIMRPETPPSPPPKIADTLQMQKDDDESMMSAFYSPVSSIFLDANATTTVEIHFLPFNVGERQCSVIFLNEEIGEFLYSIEAKATLPLPDSLPFVKTTHSVRISSAAAAGTGKGLFGGDERVVYWKCEAGQELQENLTVPYNNNPRERALMVASQQRMSNIEFSRRLTTGTLNSSIVAAQTITKLCSDPMKAIQKAKERRPQGQTYTVEADSAHYKLPDRIFIPPSGERAHSAPTGKKVYIASPNRQGHLDIPVRFRAEEPGHYPCEIVLRGTDDVRVFQIECTVNPEGSTAEITFTAPVHQNVTQEIPLVNMTNNDWPLKAHITGTGFHGPRTILAKAFQTTRYPLVFRPQNENPVAGRLVLMNTEDGTEHVFQLNGSAEKPLALEHIILKSQVLKTLTYDLKIPNVTHKKLCYRVESDLPIVSGDMSVTVLPGKQAIYRMNVAPIRRGVFKGVIAFIAGKNPVVEVDSDGDEMPDEDDETRQFYGYRVWYAIEIHVKPAPPERIIEVTCACQKKQLLEVIVRNPTQNDVTLEATIEGRDLTGAPSITLPAGSKDVYMLQYAPAVIGQTKGSLIFYHELVGEFWYMLKLMADSPSQTTLPHMECELGRWTKQNIVLENPTEEMLELIPTISNTNNFCLERDNERPIVLAPHSSLEVPLHFMPSTLGEGDHLAKITFFSEQLGEWVFVGSGTGLLPGTQDPVSVFTVAGSNTTLIIPFRNPMDTAVLCEVMLRDKNSSLEETLEGKADADNNSPFCLLLKRKFSIRVGPKSTLDIPVCFAPTEMTMFEAICTVIVTREDGEKWNYVPRDSQGYQLSRTGSDGIREVRWVFPIQGIPESRPIKESYGAMIECQARDRLEERLEVTLAGVAPVTSGPMKSIYTRSITPKNESPKLPDGIVVGESLATAEEFTYTLTYKGKDSQEDLQNSVALQLVRQHRDTASGLVVLVFNVIFNPFRTMDHGVTLEVKASQGGVWKFPIRFLALEPPEDDVLDIEASGLDQDSYVGFRLTSQSKHPVSYNAYFTAGSDPEFSVTPSSGELLPVGTNGSLIRVGFCPAVYGKIYTGKLVVQTPDMQWSYNVRGVLPEYAPPRGISSRPMRGPHPDPRYRREKTNYILDNMRLKTTAVSSPIKGAPILQRVKMA